MNFSEIYEKLQPEITEAELKEMEEKAIKQFKETIDNINTHYDAIKDYLVPTAYAYLISTVKPVIFGKVKLKLRARAARGVTSYATTNKRSVKGSYRIDIDSEVMSANEGSNLFAIDVSHMFNTNRETARQVYRDYLRHIDNEEEMIEALRKELL